MDGKGSDHNPNFIFLVSILILQGSGFWSCLWFRTNEVNEVNFFVHIMHHTNTWQNEVIPS